MTVISTITLEKRAFGWVAEFVNVPGMPDHEPMPLPFTAEASLPTVARDMRARFSPIRLFYRNKLGDRSLVAE